MVEEFQSASFAQSLSDEQPRGIFGGWDGGCGGTIRGSSGRVSDYASEQSQFESDA